MFGHRRYKLEKARATERHGAGELTPRISYPKFKAVGTKMVVFANPCGGHPWRVKVRVNKDGWVHPKDILFVGTNEIPQPLNVGTHGMRRL